MDRAKFWIILIIYEAFIIIDRLQQINQKNITGTSCIAEKWNSNSNQEHHYVKIKNQHDAMKQ